jgi:hypothetical protein
VLPELLPLVLPEVLPLVLPDVLPELPPLVLPELLPLVLPDVLPELLLPLLEPLLRPLPPSPEIVVEALEQPPPPNAASGTATKATMPKAGLNFTAFLLGNDPCLRQFARIGRHTSGSSRASIQTPFSMLHINTS